MKILLNEAYKMVKIKGNIEKQSHGRTMCINIYYNFLKQSQV